MFHTQTPKSYRIQNAALDLDWGIALYPTLFIESPSVPK